MPDMKLYQANTDGAVLQLLRPGEKIYLLTSEPFRK